MQGNLASSLSEWQVSWFFSSCGGTPGYVLEIRRVKSLKTFVCSAKSGLLCSYEGHLSNLNYAWQDNTDASGGEVGDHASLSIFQKDLGIPINFQEESSLVSF